MRGGCASGRTETCEARDDLAGGQLPSGKFGANAAWWAMTVLAFNLNVILKRHALGGAWADRRMRALRVGFLCIPGWFVRHARPLSVRISASYPALKWLAIARERIAAWLRGTDP